MLPTAARIFAITSSRLPETAIIFPISPYISPAGAPVFAVTASFWAAKRSVHETKMRTLNKTHFDICIAFSPSQFAINLTSPRASPTWRKVTPQQYAAVGVGHTPDDRPALCG